jgi:Fe2+ or Zn2+ uptake regulation protein
MATEKAAKSAVSGSIDIGFCIELDSFMENQIENNKTYRMTRQRKVILDEVRRENSHPSADEVYEMVRKRIPRISLGTVYRNLEILVEQGEIQKLELGGTVKRYDGIPKKHYHIRCIECGRVDDAPVAPLNQLEDALYGATVYTIIGHRLEFMGLCPNCTARGGESHAYGADRMLDRIHPNSIEIEDS